MHSWNKLTKLFTVDLLTCHVTPVNWCRPTGLYNSIMKQNWSPCLNLYTISQLYDMLWLICDRQQTDHLSAVWRAVSTPLQTTYWPVVSCMACCDSSVTDNKLTTCQLYDVLCLLRYRQQTDQLSAVWHAVTHLWQTTYWPLVSCMVCCVYSVTDNILTGVWSCLSAD